jgi:hypothetical protein
MRENGIFLDLGSAYQVSTFDHPGFLFQEFIYGIVGMRFSLITP